MSTYINSAGKRIHLYIIENKKNLPSIVFIPGTGCASEFYIPFLKIVSRYGYNIIGVDPVGHGHSEGARGDFTVDEIMINISDTISFVIENFNDNVGVLGSSQGGIFSFYASAYDERIKFAICHNAVFLKMEADKFFYKYWFLKPLDISFYMFSLIMPFLRVPTKRYIKWKKVVENKELLNRIYNDPIFVKKYTLRSLYSLRSYEPPKNFNEINIPVMIIVGEKDEIVPVGLNMNAFGLLRGRNKKFSLLKGATHMLLLEYIDKTLSEVLDFIKTV